MGDPKSDTYDKEKYDLLYAYDKALADSGVSKDDDDGSKNFYKAKKASGSGSGVSKKVSSNTVGTPIDLGSISLSKIVGKQTGVQQLQKVSKSKSGDLPKKRKISVGK